MSDYTSTFTEGTGDTIDATDFSTEFDAIETAIATKADSTSPTLTTPDINTPDLDGGTINGLATVGMKILATPTQISTSTTINGDVLVDMSTGFAEAFNNGATHAACVVVHSGAGALSGNITSTIYAHTTAPGTTAAYTKTRSFNVSTVSTIGAGSFIVPLDGSSDFYWRNAVSNTAGGSISGSATVYITAYFASS